MRNRLRFWVRGFLLVSLCMPLTGCWDYESISTRAALIGIGIDPVQNDPEKIRVTIQFPLLSQDVSSGTGTTSGGSTGTINEYSNLSVDAFSIIEALKKLQTQMDHDIDAAQLRAIVISRHLSRPAMESIIGQLIRMPKMNHLAYMFTTPDSAESVLGVTGSESAPIGHLERSMLLRARAYTIPREMWEYWRDTTQVGAVPILPTVRVVPSQSENRSTLALGGITVYTHGKADFDLDAKETTWLNLLSQSTKNVSISVPMGQDYLALTDVRTKVRHSYSEQQHRLTLQGRVTIGATLAKINDPSPQPLPPSDVLAMENQTSKYLTEQLTSVLAKLQQHKADVLGYGRLYLQKHPEADSDMQRHWGNTFEHAKVHIQVHVRIISKGMLI